MRYISTKVAVTKTSSLGDDCLLVDLDGPGGAPSNTIRFAVSPEVAHKIGDAAGPRPATGGGTTLDAIAFWYESTIMGPVFGTPSAQDLHMQRRHAASMEFARRLVEAFPAVLGKASA